ncbi:UNVERIFIED_CONTAM: hypothetical protein HDU68_004898 [Siphonaria sp. JEL0065]|nr:hypothetical protein HDU68_004898 [Siphonaria sp. JEL0065]
MKLSFVPTLLLATATAICAAPMFGITVDQTAKSAATNTKDSADAYFSTSSVKGFISIDNTFNVAVSIKGLPPNRNIAISLTETADFSKVKTSTKCDYDNSTPKSYFIADLSVDKDGNALAEVAFPYSSPKPEIVSALAGYGLVILQNRQYCPGGVIIAGAPIEVHTDSASSSGKSSVTTDDQSLQQFLDNKISSVGKAGFSSGPDYVVTSSFNSAITNSKITGSVKLDASGNVYASLSGLPPNEIVMIGATYKVHAAISYKGSNNCVLDNTNPLSYTLVQFVADKYGNVIDHKSYKTYGDGPIKSWAPTAFAGHDIVLYRHPSVCPAGTNPMVGAVATLV